MEFPDGLRYTKSHEWAKKDGQIYIVGITEYAQKELSDVVYVELPDVGREMKATDSACVVESVKAAFDIYTPLSGTIVAVNDALEDDPSLVNSAPYEAGWLFKIEISNEDEINTLMDTAAYSEIVNG